MKKIPCVMIRGGTSKGAFLLAEHLPEDQAQRDKILMAIMGSGNGLETDGTGGGNPSTGRAATISRPSDPHVDVGYLSVQVIAREQCVDTTPNCGNMLSGVGVLAIESGLITATPSVIRVRIRNVSTDTFIKTDIQTPNGVVGYEGSTRIDGVPGTAAPVALIFLNAVETKTGRVFPTDNQIDYFDDVPVVCIDMTMPAVIISTEYLGKTGYESPAELDANRALLARIESTRLQTGKAMSSGDVSNMVIPKSILISPAQKSGVINVRYFMPYSCHRVLAITGAIATSSSHALEDIVTRQIAPSVGYGNVNIEHLSDALDVHLSSGGQDATMLRVSVIRTTRKILSGEVHLP